MFYLLTLLAGVLINIMVAANGSLAGFSGLYSAVVISYIIAITASFLWLKCTGKPVFPKEKVPLWAYAGGVVSVFSAVCSNFAFGKISMIAITALGLLAQTVTSLVIDTAGLFGFEKRPAKLAVWVCVLVSFAGMAVMLWGAELTALAALLLSFAAGVSLVTSRMLSARLAQCTSPVGSSFLTHLAGLPAAVLVLLLIGRNELGSFSMATIPLWAYTGGLLGIIILALTNITLKKVSALNVTLLIFVGQVLSGALIDYIMGNSFSSRSFIGGLIISAGMIAQALLSRKKES